MVYSKEPINEQMIWYSELTGDWERQRPPRRPRFCLLCLNKGQQTHVLETPACPQNRMKTDTTDNMRALPRGQD